MSRSLSRVSGSLGPTPWSLLRVSGVPEKLGSRERRVRAMLK